MDEGKHVIAVGASTGGIEALKVLVEDLPGDFAAPMLVVQHTSASSPNVLDRILARVSAVPVRLAKANDLMIGGHVYVAPADHHLVVDPAGRLHVTRGPKENRVRPAIDPLFRSVAAGFGPRAIGVLLTGLLDDGTAGLRAIRERGGTAIVQHPEDAVAPAMPLNALKQVDVNHVLPLHEIAPLLARLTAQPARRGAEDHESAAGRQTRGLILNDGEPPAR